jgi:2-polyprenyl-3-methyl-5-hydroxy-6-metoxy-1,4-benzoquinol methylase
VKTDYAAIYDRVTRQHPNYNAAEWSPGFKSVLRYGEKLRGIKGRSLDVGCGVGFVVQLMSSPLFGFDSFACDISSEAVGRARQRLGEGSEHRVRLIESDGALPFGDGEFEVVTCFDVLEHLDEPDVIRLRDELRRVRKASGATLMSVSLRPAGSEDHHGDNLHRTVRSIQFWIDLFKPDETIIDHGLQQGTMFIGPRA